MTEEDAVVVVVVVDADTGDFNLPTSNSKRHLRRNDPDGAKWEYIFNQVLDLDDFEDRVDRVDDGKNKVTNISPNPIYDVDSLQYKAYVWAC